MKFLKLIEIDGCLFCKLLMGFLDVKYIGLDVENFSRVNPTHRVLVCPHIVKLRVLLEEFK